MRVGRGDRGRVRGSSEGGERGDRGRVRGSSEGESGERGDRGRVRGSSEGERVRVGEHRTACSQWRLLSSRNVA